MERCQNVIFYVTITIHSFKITCYNIIKYLAEEQIYKIGMQIVNLFFSTVNYCKAGHFVFNQAASPAAPLI